MILKSVDLGSGLFFTDDRRGINQLDVLLNSRLRKGIILGRTKAVLGGQRGAITANAGFFVIR